MKAKLFTIFFVSILISCSSKVTQEAEVLDIQKYKGYRIVEKMQSDYVDREYYLIRNDSIAIELRTPKWFHSLYSVGDTIK